MHCMPTMCQPVDSRVYTNPYISGGGCNDTEKSGMKTLFSVKYFKPSYLRLTLPPLNRFHPSLKSLHCSMENSASPVGDGASSNGGAAVFHYWVHVPW